MLLEIIKIENQLHKTYETVKPFRKDLILFKEQINKLVSSIDIKETEENAKNYLRDFFKNSFYTEDHLINTKGRTDLVIHIEKTARSNAGVLFEIKRPINKSEMVKSDNLNSMAMHELMLYYLRERIDNKNIEMKNLIITNIYEWFIFDASEFDKLFYQNKKLIKDYTEWKTGKKVRQDTALFYDEIAKPFLNELDETIKFVHINIKDYENELKQEHHREIEKLIPIYKIFSPEHLLKLPIQNDSNTLNVQFYLELLHILGLEERTENKILKLKLKKSKSGASLVENTINQIKSHNKLNNFENIETYGNNREEQIFNIAVELVITWLNRLLFLKLLEGQIINYHKNDKAYKFLRSEKINFFGQLDTLFFQVLAVKIEQRSENIKEQYPDIPYLNSSLFEPAEIEHKSFFINSLDHTLELSLYNRTILTDSNGKSLKHEKRPTLKYLLDFFDAYNFSSDAGSLLRSNKKTLISAAVLGLIFEKINGYKDGSYFTPSFVTIYMNREIIRRTIVNKFNQKYAWNCEYDPKLINLYNFLDVSKIKEYNEIVNSITICDPAVGSGHFLVSALNEIITAKSDLQILTDNEGKRLKYKIENINDELEITDEDGQMFYYTITNNKIPVEKQRVQKTIFHEKQTLIENSLFGVDINANSVKITRLRLWIELLKNAYYKPIVKTLHATSLQSQLLELQTLPNIDINIKQGNSLVNRFELQSDLSKALKKTKWNFATYLDAVQAYKNSTDRNAKQEIVKLIAEIKSKFETEISQKDPRVIKLYKLKAAQYNKTAQKLLDINLSASDRKKEEKEIINLENQIDEIESNMQAEKSGVLYRKAFEWRFEFPEVLDTKDGSFKGFDVVLGNPPYIFTRQADFDKQFKTYVKQNYFSELENTGNSRANQTGKINLYGLFLLRAIKLIKPDGIFSFIVPNTVLRTTVYESLRKYLLDNCSINKIIDLKEGVFKGVTAATVILILDNDFKNNEIKIVDNPQGEEEIIPDFKIINKKTFYDNTSYTFNIFVNKKEYKLFEKMQKLSVDLSELLDVLNGIATYKNKQGIVKLNTGNNCKKILFGRNIKQYYHVWDGDYVEYIPKNLQRARAEKIFLAPEKLIMQRIGGKLTTSYDNEQYYTFNTVNNLLPKQSLYSLKYLLAILNSDIMQFYFIKNFTNASKLTVNATKTALDKFPIARIDFNNTKQKNIYNNIIKETDQLLKFEKKADKKIIKKRINKLVYKLYNLTKAEIKIIENETT